MLDPSPIYLAIADPTRRRILELLARRNLTAGDIADQFSISKPSISYHLNTLKQAKLVRFQRHGQHLVYGIDTTVLTEVMNWIVGLEQLKLQGRQSNETSPECQTEVD